MRKLYDVEDEANAIIVKDKLTGAAAAAIRLRLRKEQSVPLLASLRQWLLEQKEQVLPKSPIAAAINYMLNQWEALHRYTTDGDLHIDNNISERTLKLIGMGRINWLFLGSDKGGQTAAVLFSFTATCKHLRIDTFAYLRDMFERLPTHPADRLDELLPHRWQLARQATASTPNALAQVTRMYPDAFRRKTATRVHHVPREIHRRCTTSPGNPPPHWRDVIHRTGSTLLPDATILSAGGGEFRPNSAVHIPNLTQDSHANAQIFTPPYLHASRGPRPVIGAGPDTLQYGKTADITVANAASITKVTLLRLGSTTHSFDQNQRINLLKFNAAGNTLTVTAPPDANHCPPGNYMLFVLNGKGVPSKAKIMRIGSAVVSAAATAHLVAARQPIRLPMLADQIQMNAAGTHLVIGVTPTCPYGLAACWAGAYHALKNLEGVADVGPIPNAEDSTADVYLKSRGLPDLSRWPQQFTQIASGSQKFRGVEVSFDGDVMLSSSQLVLPATADHPIISLSPLDPTEIVPAGFGDAATACRGPRRN